MKKLLFSFCLVFVAGCFAPKQLPGIDNAMKLRDQAIQNVQQNYVTLIQASLTMYEASEIRYLTSLVELDLSTGYAEVAKSGKTPTFEEYKAFFAKLQTQKEIGIAKVKQRCDAIRNLLVLAQSDMMLHVKLTNMLDTYYRGQGENSQNIEAFIQKLFVMAEGYIKK